MEDAVPEQCNATRLGLPLDVAGAPPAAGTPNRRCKKRALRAISAAALLTLGGAASAGGSVAAAPPSPDAEAAASAEMIALEPTLRAVDEFLDVSRARNRSRERRRLLRSDPARTAIRRMLIAGNRIAKLPYIFGGGHGSFVASGYDCSGSVSYLLHAAGKLSSPEDSSGLMSYGEPGPGRYVTIYSNPQHALITVRGRRFDTIAFQETGTRWSSSLGELAGYTVRHPRGM